MQMIFTPGPNAVIEACVIDQQDNAIVSLDMTVWLVKDRHARATATAGVPAGLKSISHQGLAESIQSHGTL